MDRIVLGVYLLLFGTIIAVTAVAYWQPVREWTKFMYSWLGRGASFVFLGLLSLNTSSILVFLVPLVVVAIGVIYIVLAFTSSVPVPLPMLRSDALISEYEKEHPGYPDRRRQHNRMVAQARLDKQARKQNKEAEQLRKRERDLAEKESVDKA